MSESTRLSRVQERLWVSLRLILEVIRLERSKLENSDVLYLLIRGTASEVFGIESDT